MRKITIILIFLASLTALAGFYYYQKNIYSKEILKLEILGPESIDLLQEVEYIVKYKNNGDMRLDEPELIFEYPKNAIPINETQSRVIKKAEDLGGAIYPGEEKSIIFKAVILGRENDSQTAKATFSFQPKDLKARYEVTTSFTNIIKKVPFTLDFDLPAKTESGKDLNFRLNYFSNIDFPLSGLRLSVEYPAGFEFISSNPKSPEKTEWNLGLLNKSEGGRIEIAGKIRGDMGEEKTFKAKIGVVKDGEFILIKEIGRAVAISNPSLYVNQQINSSPRYIVSPGDLLHYEISFQNLGDEPLSNLSLINRLQGKSFDFSSIRAPEGNFESGDGSVVFDWKRVQKLQFLAPGESGEVEFWIQLKEEWPIAGTEDKNVQIKNKIYLGQIKEEFTNKVNSKIIVSQTGYFNDDIFGNTGALPPEVGKETTYTITWKLQNYYNDVSNVKVIAVLPDNVELAGKFFPEDELSKFTFDSGSREIVWQAGDLKMSQGVDGTPAPNISFQVQLTPTESQVGQTPLIIGRAEAEGQDQWTGVAITATDRSIDTTLPDDDTVSSDMGIVK